MTTPKRMGIWMDHSRAYLMELDNNNISTSTIESEFTHEDKVETLERSETIMHNKEQQKQGAYYKRIKEVVAKYDELLLFGPTTAKDELSNLLKDDQLFQNKEIAVLQSDKMTENQKHAFVKDYFHNKNNK